MQVALVFLLVIILSAQVGNACKANGGSKRCGNSLMRLNEEFRKYIRENNDEIKRSNTMRQKGASFGSMQKSFETEVKRRAENNENKRAKNEENKRAKNDENKRAKNDEDKRAKNDENKRAKNNENKRAKNDKILRKIANLIPRP